MMPAYVIAKRGAEFLVTPVFHAGPSGKEEAIAVFTNRPASERYIEQAGWGNDHEVGELDDIQLLRWTVKAHAQGTQYLAIDPNRVPQMEGEAQKIIVIEEKLAGFAESLTRDIVRSSQHEAL